MPRKTRFSYVPSTWQDARHIAGIHSELTGHKECLSQATSLVNLATCLEADLESETVA